SCPQLCDFGAVCEEVSFHGCSYLPSALDRNHRTPQTLGIPGSSEWPGDAAGHVPAAGYRLRPAGSGEPARPGRHGSCSRQAREGCPGRLPPGRPAACAGLLWIGSCHVPLHFGAYPAPNRSAHPIADLAVGRCVGYRELEPVGHTLQPRILADGVRAHTQGKAFVCQQARGLVLRVVSNARGCNVVIRRIADDRQIPVASGHTGVDSLGNRHLRVCLDDIRQPDRSRVLQRPHLEGAPRADDDQPMPALRQPGLGLDRAEHLHVVVRQFAHRLHDHREGPHPGHVLDHIELGASDRQMPQRMQEELVTGAGAVDVGDGAVLRAGVGEDHAVAAVLLEHQLLGDIRLLHMGTQVVAIGFAGIRVQLEGLIDRDPCFEKADIHQACSAEVGVNGGHGYLRSGMAYSCHNKGACMKKDCVVWGGCLLLLGAGAVWSPLLIDVFAHSQSVLGALADAATVFGVVVASVVGIAGLRVWRHQLYAAQENDLARRGLTSLYKLRNAIKAVRNPYIADFEMALEPGREVTSYVDAASYGTIQAYNNRFQNVWQARTEIDALMLEAEVIWGDSLIDLYSKLFDLQHQLYIYLDVYCKAINPDITEDMRVRYAQIRDAKT